MEIPMNTSERPKDAADRWPVLIRTTPNGIARRAGLVNPEHVDALMASKASGSLEMPGGATYRLEWPHVCAACGERATGDHAVCIEKHDAGPRACVFADLCETHWWACSPSVLADAVVRIKEGARLTSPRASVPCAESVSPMATTEPPPPTEEAGLIGPFLAPWSICVERIGDGWRAVFACPPQYFTIAAASDDDGEAQVHVLGMARMFAGAMRRLGAPPPSAPSTGADDAAWAADRSDGAK
jgi:hypothetical protein